MRKLMRLIGFTLLAGAAVFVAAAYNRPLTPEESRHRELVANKQALIEAIKECEGTIQADEKAVYQARLSNIKASTRGSAAAAEGLELRARTEELRDENVRRLNRLRARLAEAEAELREELEPRQVKWEP